MVAMPFVVALRPVNNDARVGEHNAVVWKFENCTPSVGDAPHVRALDRPAVDVHRGVAEVVPRQEQHVGRAIGRLGRQIGLPVGLGVSNVQRDLSLERLGHGALHGSATVNGWWDSYFMTAVQAGRHPNRMIRGDIVTL